MCVCVCVCVCALCGSSDMWSLLHEKYGWSQLTAASLEMSSDISQESLSTEGLSTIRRQEAFTTYLHPVNDVT